MARGPGRQSAPINRNRVLAPAGSSALWGTAISHLLSLGGTGAARGTAGALAPGGATPAPAAPQGPADPATAPPRRDKWRWLPRGAAALLMALILLAGWLAFTAPLSKSLQPIAPPQITLLAADGTPIARNGAIVEAPVDAARLPKHVVQAFLAVEDRRFYSHWGIDPRGIARAAWSNLTGGSTQGGSTITQQLAKFTFLTPERSLMRKGREVLIAFWLEIWLTKDEILERYLSNAYFGDNTYGLRAASLHYFHRQPENLTPGQAAMLAGLVRAPSSLAPTGNYAGAVRRMRVVRQAMVDAGYLTARQARAIAPPRLDVRTRGALPTGTYFADWALPEARRQGETGYARQTITTTLDARLQAAARRAVARAPLGKAQVALVAMRGNGEVVAMIGGRNYDVSPFNRATQARRQPGSTFKLFVYLAALRDGWNPGDTIANTPFTSGSYRPKNAGGTYSPIITLEDGFARSSNVAAVRLMERVGSEKVIAVARDLGVTSPLPTGDPSLALGTSTMTLLELTSAYAGISANRFPVRASAFPAAGESWTDWLWDWRKSLPGEARDGMREMLRAAVTRGTGRAAALPREAFGKTGTSQDNRDALFIGYSGDLVVGVWVGNDDNSPLAGVTGGGLPARIWRDFMRSAFRIETRPPRRADPAGPVQPQDAPMNGAGIVLGEAGRLRIENGDATISAEIGGLPVDVRINRDSVTLDGRRTFEEATRQLREQAQEAAGPVPGPSGRR